MIYCRIIEGMRCGKCHFFPGPFALCVALFLNLSLLTRSVVAGPSATGATNAAMELTTADGILSLSMEEAQRGQSVKLQGIVTCVVQEHDAFIIQDSSAVFVTNASGMSLPEKGRLLEVEGKTYKG